MRTKIRTLCKVSCYVIWHNITLCKWCKTNQVNFPNKDQLSTLKDIHWDNKTQTHKKRTFKKTGRVGGRKKPVRADAAALLQRSDNITVVQRWRKFDAYMPGADIIIRTDHKPCARCPLLRSVILSYRDGRSKSLNIFTALNTLRVGKLNVVVDMLSRSYAVRPSDRVKLMSPEDWAKRMANR